MKVILEIPDEVLPDVQALANVKGWSRKQYMQYVIIKDSESKKSQRLVKSYKAIHS